MENFDDLESFDLLAVVALIKNDFGGRKTPVIDGYRGQFFWHINHVSGTDWDASYYFEKGSLAPGNDALCKIKLSPFLKETSDFNFPIGRQFGIREGSKIIGTGVIKECYVKKP